MPSLFLLEKEKAMPEQAIVLLSAGLDSTVGLALALEAGVEVTLALCFDYGQKAALRERQRAQSLAQHYQLELQIIELPWLGEITHTALSATTENELPDVGLNQLDQIASVTLASALKVWVPNRNGLLLNIAAAFADSRGETLILTGFNAEEAATFPDNTPQFSQAISHSLAFSTQIQPQVKSFVQALNKIEIFQEAVRLQVPLDLIWSCYRGGPLHCGHCESCSRLWRAAHANHLNALIENQFQEIPHA
jgi:7-cyano-7-deazaguanine synthase